MLAAGGDVNVTDAVAQSTLSSVGVSAGNLNVTANGVNTRLQAGTDMIISVGNNVEVQAIGADAEITNFGGAGGLMQITAGGNIVVAGTNGNAQIFGSPNVDLILSGATSEIQITGTPTGYGRIWAESPSTINVFFTQRSDGGYSVNGVEGGTFDPLSMSGFYVGTPGSEIEAVLDSSLLVQYGIAGLPDIVIAALNSINDAINGSDDFQAGENDEDPDSPQNKKKDEEKNKNVCN